MPHYFQENVGHALRKFPPFFNPLKSFIRKPRNPYINHIEITNKRQPCTRIYYSNVLLIAQHVSSDTPLIIRAQKRQLQPLVLHTSVVAGRFTAAGNHRRR
jgi:hypothetical protein